MQMGIYHSPPSRPKCPCRLPAVRAATQWHHDPHEYRVLLGGSFPDPYRGRVHDCRGLSWREIHFCSLVSASRSTQRSPRLGDSLPESYRQCLPSCRAASRHGPARFWDGRLRNGSRKLSGRISAALATVAPGWLARGPGRPAAAIHIRVAQLSSTLMPRRAGR